MYACTILCLTDSYIMQAHTFVHHTGLYTLSKFSIRHLFIIYILYEHIFHRILYSYTMPKCNIHRI